MRVATYPTSRTDRFSYRFSLVFVGLVEREEKCLEEEEEENSKIVLGSNTSFDDVSFLKRFESIVQNISFGLKIRERERE